MQKVKGTDLPQKLKNDLEDKNRYCQKAFILAEQDGRKSILWDRYYEQAEVTDMEYELENYEGFLPLTGCNITFNGTRIPLSIVEVLENRIASGEIVNSINEAYNGIITLGHIIPGRNKIDTVHKVQLEYSTDRYYKYSYSKQYGAITIQEMPNKGGGKKVDITDEQAIQMYNQYYEEKVPIKDLAEQYSVSESTVRRITRQYR